jgi:integrase
MITILNELNVPETQYEWMIALLHAATALRPEETFSLQWQDMDWKNGQINIQRAWFKGEPTAGKNRNSMTQVIMSPVPAEALKRWRGLTLYRKLSDWLFPSIK